MARPSNTNKTPVRRSARITRSSVEPVGTTALAMEIPDHQSSIPKSTNKGRLPRQSSSSSSSSSLSSIRTPTPKAEGRKEPSSAVPPHRLPRGNFLALKVAMDSPSSESSSEYDSSSSDSDRSCCQNCCCYCYHDSSFTTTPITSKNDSDPPHRKRPYSPGDPDGDPREYDSDELEDRDLHQRLKFSYPGTRFEGRTQADMPLYVRSLNEILQTAANNRRNLVPSELRRSLAREFPNEELPRGCWRLSALEEEGPEAALFAHVAEIFRGAMEVYGRRKPLADWYPLISTVLNGVPGNDIDGVASELSNNLKTFTCSDYKLKPKYGPQNRAYNAWPLPGIRLDLALGYDANHDSFARRHLLPVYEDCESLNPLLKVNQEFLMVVPVAIQTPSTLSLQKDSDSVATLFGNALLDVCHHWIQVATTYSGRSEGDEDDEDEDEDGDEDGGDGAPWPRPRRPAGVPPVVAAPVLPGAAARAAAVAGTNQEEGTDDRARVRAARAERRARSRAAADADNIINENWDFDIPVVVGLSVKGHHWSYFLYIKAEEKPEPERDSGIVLKTWECPPIKNILTDSVPCVVYGPYFAGQTDTLVGVFQLVRFVSTLRRWLVNNWMRIMQEQFDEFIPEDMDGRFRVHEMYGYDQITW